MANPAYEISSPFTINGLSATLETAKDGLLGTFRDTELAQKDDVPSLYKPFSIGKRKVKTFKLNAYGGIPDAKMWNGGNAGIPIPTQGTSFLYQVTATYLWWANACGWDINAETFDAYDLMKDNVGELKESMVAKRNALATAGYYNGFFSGSFFDGCPLFSQYHPYAPNAVLPEGIPPVQCNVVQGTASATTYAAMKQYIIGQRDSMGRPRHLSPRILRCHSTWVEAWNQIIGQGQNRIYQGPLNPGTSTTSSPSATPLTSQLPNIGITPQNANDVIKNTFEGDGVVIMPWDNIYPVDAAFLFANEWHAHWSDAVPITPYARGFGEEKREDYSYKLESRACSLLFFKKWFGIVALTGASIAAA